MNAREFALERLRGLHARPMMWAATREAFVAQVLLLLEFLDEHEAARGLMHTEFKVPGTCAADRDKLAASVDDDWGRTFVRNVLERASPQLSREFLWQEKPKVQP